MSLPKASGAYPSALIHAVTVAHDLGELRIPCENPLALRLQFNGLRGALRREGAAGKIDSLGFYIEKSPDTLILRVKTATPLIGEVAQAISTALKGEIPEIHSDDDALTRAEITFFAKLEKP